MVVIAYKKKCQFLAVLLKIYYHLAYEFMGRKLKTRDFTAIYMKCGDIHQKDTTFVHDKPMNHGAHVLIIVMAFTQFNIYNLKNSLKSR